MTKTRVSQSKTKFGVDMSTSIPFVPQQQEQQPMTRAEFRAKFGRDPITEPSTEGRSPWEKGLTRSQFKEIFGRDPVAIQKQEYIERQQSIGEAETAGGFQSLLTQGDRDVARGKQSGLLTTPIVGPAVAGLGMAGGRALALGETMLTGGESVGREVDRMEAALAEVQPGFVSEAVRGVVQAAPTMTTGAGVSLMTGNPALGFSAMIGMSGGQAMNDAYRETKDPGYALRAGLIEAGITALFQGAGRGGLEAAATKGFKQGFKAFAKVFGEEIPEELSILFFDEFNRFVSGYSPNRKLDVDTVSRDFYNMAQVAAQTALMAGFGAATAPRRAAAPPTTQAQPQQVIDLGDATVRQTPPTTQAQPQPLQIGFETPAQGPTQGAAPSPITPEQQVIDLGDATIRQTPKKLQRFETLFDEAAAQTGIQPDILMAIAQVESGGNPKAVSPKGAKGIMQIMDATAQELGVQDATDPNQAIPAAARYLARGLERHNGDLDLALADYNAGPGNVDKYGGVPPFKETQEYIRKVRSAMAAIQGDTVTASLLRIPPDKLQQVVDTRVNKGKPITAKEVKEIIGEGDKESVKPVRDWVNQQVEALPPVEEVAPLPELRAAQAPEVAPSPATPLPESILASFPDLLINDSGLISINQFTQAERDALREAGLIEEGTLSTGEKTSGVDPEKLWPLRQAAQAAQKPRKVDEGEAAAARERRASFYDRLAEEQESLGEYGDQEAAEKYRAKAAEIRSRRPASGTAQPASNLSKSPELPQAAAPVAQPAPQPQQEGGEPYGMRQEAQGRQGEVTPAQQAGGVQVPPPAKQPWEMTEVEYKQRGTRTHQDGIDAQNDAFNAMNALQKARQELLQLAGTEFKDRGYEKALKSTKPGTGEARRKLKELQESYDSAVKKASKYESHKYHVESALRQGQPVPASVLADYPDLAAKYQQPSARTQTLQTAAQNLAAIEGKAEPVVSEGQSRAFERLTTPQPGIPSEPPPPAQEPLTFRRVKVGKKNAYDTTVSGRTVTIDRTAAEPGLPFEVRVEGQSAPVDFFRTLGEAKDYISNTLRQEMEAEAQGEAEPMEAAPAQPVVKQGLTAEPKRKEPWEMTREEWLNDPIKRRLEAQAAGVKGVEREKIVGKGRDARIKKYNDNPDNEQVYLHAVESHKNSVESALASGKPVPASVLADYPDLAAKYAQPTPEESSVAATRPEPSANIPNYDGPISKQYSIEATRKNAKPMLDPKGKPTGWRAIQAENGTILIHPTENRTVAFVHEGDQSKASLIRRKRMLAQAFAMDNPIEAKVSPAPETQGELVTKPVFQPSGETGQLATPRPIWKMPFKQYAKERMASEGLTNPADIAEREQELRRVHRRAVQDAIAAGEKVPMANVKEYGGEQVATPTKVSPSSPEQAYSLTYTAPDGNRVAVHFSKARFNDLPEELQQDVQDALSRANSYGDSKEAKELNDFIEGKTVRFLQRNERNNETPQYTIYDTEGEFRQAFARFATDTSGRFHDRLLSDSSKRLAAEIIAERDAAQNEAQAKSQMEQQERQLKERQFQEIVAEIDEIPMPKGERVSFRPAGTFEDVSGIKYGAWILHKSPVKGKTKLSHYQSGLGMSPRTPLSTPEAKRFIKGTLKANADVDFIDNASGKEKVKALGEIYNFLFRGGDVPASLTTTSTPAKPAPATGMQPTTPTSATILSDLRDQAREDGLNPIEQKKRNDRLRQAFDEQYPGSGGKAFSDFMRTGNPPKKPKRGADPTNPQAGVINLDAPKAAWDAFSDFMFRQTVGPFTKSRPMGVAEAEAFRIARRAQEGVANRGNLQKENALITFKRALRQRVGGEKFTRSEKQLVSRASDLSRKDKRIRTALAPKNATKADVMQSVRDVLDGKSKVLLLPEKVYNASEGMRDLLAAGSDFLVENGIASSEGLITAIKDNVGFWLRRSYRVHKDPNWVKTVQGRPEWDAAIDAMEKEWREFVDTPENQTDLELIQFGRRHLPGVKNAKALNEIEAALKDDPNNETLGPEVRAKVEEALRALGKPDRDQLEIRLTEMLQEMSNEGRENFANRRLGSQNRSSFMRRNEIPKWLRDVMGEYHDTEINFALSSEAMTQMISAWTFSQKLYELGYNKFIFNTREEIPASLKGSYYTKVPDNPKYGMLAGKYTSQELKDAIDQKIAEAGTIGKLFNTLSGTIRWLLTIGNVATGGGIRNFVTSGIGAMLRGDIPIATGAKFFRVLNKERAIMPALAKSLNMEYTSELGMLKALAQHHLEMVERGVHDSDPNFNLAKDRLKDSFLNDLLTGKLGEESYLDVPREKVLALKRKMENLWLFGDNFWKSVSHAETMNRWSNYAKKQRWSEQRLRDYIDGAIRGVTPTYAETYEIINRMKRTGTGAVYQDFITWQAERFRNKVNLVRLIRDELATGDKTLMASAAMRIATLAVHHLGFTALLPIIGKWGLGSDSDDEDWAVRQFVPAWMNNSAIAYLGDRGEDGNYRIADLSYLDPDAWMNKMIFSAFQGDWDEVPKTFAETFFGVAIAAELTAELMTNTKGNQQPIWLSTDSVRDWLAKVGRHVIFRAGGTPAKFAVHAYEKAHGKQQEIGARSLHDQAMSMGGSSIWTVNPKENTRHYALKTAAQFRAISKQITDSMTKYPNQDEKALREKYGNQRNKSAEELVRIGVAGRETGLTQNQIRQIFKDASIRQDYIAKIMMAIERSYNDMKKTGVRDFSVQLPTGDKAKGGGGLFETLKPMEIMKPLTIPGL